MYDIHIYGNILFLLNLKNFLLFTEKYQKLENEKKNTRTIRKAQTGPMIRYQSLAMPIMILSEVNYNKEEDKMNIEKDEKNTNFENKRPDETIEK